MTPKPARPAASQTSPAPTPLDPAGSFEEGQALSMDAPPSKLDMEGPMQDGSDQVPYGASSTSMPQQKQSAAAACGGSMSQWLPPNSSMPEPGGSGSDAPGSSIPGNAGIVSNPVASNWSAAWSSGATGTSQQLQATQKMQAEPSTANETDDAHADRAGPTILTSGLGSSNTCQSARWAATGIDAAATSSTSSQHSSPSVSSSGGIAIYKPFPALPRLQDANAAQDHSLSRCMLPQPALASRVDPATAVTLGNDPASNPLAASSASSPANQPEAASQSPVAAGACKPGNLSPAASGTSKPGNVSPASGIASIPGNASSAPTALPAQLASPAVTPSVQAASDAGKPPGTQGAAEAAGAVEGEPAAMEVDATRQAAAASSTAAALSTAQLMEQTSPGKAAETAIVRQDANLEDSYMAVDEKAAAHVSSALVRTLVVRREHQLAPQALQARNLQLGAQVLLAVSAWWRTGIVSPRCKIK